MNLQPPPIQRTCPHCQALNLGGGDFCTQCGKAIPALGGTSPTFISRSQNSLAKTKAGTALQINLLQRLASRKAFRWLLLLAIGCTAIGLVICFLQGNNPAVSKGDLRALLIANLVLGGAYLALALWAQTSPLIPAILGLALYIGVNVFNASLGPSTIAVGWLWKVLIVIALIKAIKAGLAYKKLQDATGQVAE